MHRELRVKGRAPAGAIAVLAATLGAGVHAAEPSKPADRPKAPTMTDVLAASKPSDWRALDPDRTLYLELPSGRVVIELAPEFAPKHVANLRTLVREKFFDGLAIVRVHDNYVVQWGDPDGQRSLGSAARKLEPEYERASAGLPFRRLLDGDVYAPEVGWSGGFPVARDPAAGRAWLAHCYGMVGVGRDLAPDSGNAAELYVVIGHAPRHLDRNITTIGRVVQGIEKLTALPRGTGALGFYEDPSQRVPIRSLRFASELPVDQRTHLEVLRTDTATFDALVETRRNRRDAFFLRPAGRVDLCNVPIAVRVAGTRGGSSAGTAASTPAGASADAAAPTPAAGGAPVSPAQPLLGTTWHWVRTVDPERNWTPADPKRYTLTLQPEGRAQVRADCNRGMGSYTHGGSSLQFGPLATTKMLCTEAAGLDARYLQQLGAGRIVAQAGGLLRLDLLADSGTMFFAAEPDARVRDYRCDGGRSAWAVYTAQRARVVAGPQVHDLPAVPSASGAKYAAGDVVWWTKGDEAALEQRDTRVLTNCRASDGTG
jgi:peptidylprolyl isomerase